MIGTRLVSKSGTQFAMFDGKYWSVYGIGVTRDNERDVLHSIMESYGLTLNIQQPTSVAGDAEKHE